MNFFEWLNGEASKDGSRAWQKLERLRRLAAGADRGGYRDSTGPLTGKAWEELLDSRHYHVLDYVRGCKAFSKWATGTDSFAKWVHNWICHDPAWPPRGLPGLPAPVGTQASAWSAHLTAASHANATGALDRYFRRTRPTVRDLKGEIELQRLALAAIRAYHGNAPSTPGGEGRE